MDAVQVIYKNLPHHAKGFMRKNNDDTCTIFLNCRLSFEQNKKTFQHELEHLNDFKHELNVSTLESIRHKNF